MFNKTNWENVFLYRLNGLKLSSYILVNKNNFILMQSVFINANKLGLKLIHSSM